MTDITHRTLLRQLSKLGLDPSTPPDADGWAALLDRVARAYEQADTERYLAERSMGLASAEMRVLHDAAAAHNDFLAAIISSLSDGLCVIGADGRVELENPAAAAILTSGTGSLMGLDERTLLSRVTAAEGEPDPRDTLIAARHRGEAASIDVAALQSESGPARWVALAVTPVTPCERHPDSRRAVLVVRDITSQTLAAGERERLEQKLRQSQRLEAIGQLAGGVAHDFNNLLAAIMTSAELLADDVDGEALEEVAEIRNSAKRGAELTRKLLLFARRDRSEPEVIEVDEVISDMERLLVRTLGGEIEVTTDLCDESAAEVDPADLEQILMNLALNARDAMAEGGNLLIETRRVVIENGMVNGLRAGEYVVLTVSDEGEGMSPEVRARAMEPFFTTKDVGKGTGLGLATIYGIATRAGGSVSIYSEPDLGTTVRVYLPAARAGAPEAESAAPVADAAEPTSGRRILLVEDEPAVRAATTRLLSRHGYDVVVAEDGSSALAAAADHVVDVVLSDVVMPGGISGADVARSIKETNPDLAIVLMSGYSEGAVTDRGMLPAGVHLVEKPFSAATLLGAIDAACRTAQLAGAP